MTFYSIYFGSVRVLLPHAELHHLSTSINGRRRYRLDQSTPSLAAIARRSSTKCRRPRTPPRKLPRSSHESSHARLALYPPRTSHFTITPRNEIRQNETTPVVYLLTVGQKNGTEKMNDKTKLVKEAKNDKASRCCWSAYQKKIRKNGIRRNAIKRNATQPIRPVQRLTVTAAGSQRPGGVGRYPFSPN